jgi:hypothetical protein
VFRVAAFRSVLRLVIFQASRGRLGHLFRWIPPWHKEKYSVSSYTEAPVRAASRPGSLVAAMGVAIVAGLAAIGSGIVILSGGLELIKDLGNKLVAKELGISEEEVQATFGLVGPELDSLWSEAQTTFQARAYAVLICGALLVLFGVLMRTGATWARILVTLAALATAAMALLIVTDVANGLMMALGYGAIVAAVVAVVLAWLPANGRYAKATSR